MATCTACSCPKRVDIDAALARGVSVRVVAEMFGISKSAAERHKNRCLKARLTAESRKADRASQPRPDPGPIDLLTLNGVMGRLARSVQRLEGAAEAAADTGSYQGLAAVSGQLLRAVDTVCKIQGLYVEKAAPAPTTTFGVQIILPGGSISTAVPIGSAVESDMMVVKGTTILIDTDAMPPMPGYVRRAIDSQDLEAAGESAF